MEGSEIITRIVAIIGLLIGLFSVSFIIFFIFSRSRGNRFFIEKQKIEKELQETGVKTQEATMSSIGKELHDNVGQLLGSARMLLGITERTLNPVPESLIIANETLGKAISEIRSLSRILNKEWLEQFSFHENLDQELKRIRLSGNINIHCKNSGDVSKMEAEEQVILFRIIQEAIQNALRHSAATEINIGLQTINNTLEIIIRDNGCGFDISDTNKSGIGLLNMQHRAALLNGHINWISRPGEGTAITIVIPQTQKRSS